MIEQILKYLPLLGLLGLIWGIIQFYQKRSYIKSDLKREEKRSYFREVDIIINDIKNEYWKFFATISQTTLSLKKKINHSNEKIDLEEKYTKSSGLELDYIEELDTAAEILENIEKEGYNEEEHKNIIKEQLKSAKKRQKILKSSLKEKKKKLDELKTNQAELKSFLENRNLKLSDKTKQTSRSLQGFILDLNKVSLVGIDDKYTLKSLIFDLTNSIQKLINQLETEDEITRGKIAEVIEMENIQETMSIISKIEEHIYKA